MDESEICDDCEYEKAGHMTYAQYANKIIKLLHGIRRPHEVFSLIFVGADRPEYEEMIEAVNAGKIPGFKVGKLWPQFTESDFIVIDLLTIGADEAIRFVRWSQWTGQAIVVTGIEDGEFRHADFMYISDLKHQVRAQRSRDVIKFLETKRGLYNVAKPNKENGMELTEWLEAERKRKESAEKEKRVYAKPIVPVIEEEEAYGLDRKHLIDTGLAYEDAKDEMDEAPEQPPDHFLIEAGLKCVFRSSDINPRYEVYAGERGAAIFNHECEDATVYVKGGGAHCLDGVGPKDVYDEAAAIIEKHDIRIAERDQRIFTKFAMCLVGKDETATFNDAEIKWSTSLGEASLKKRGSHNYLVTAKLTPPILGSRPVIEDEINVSISMNGSSIDHAISKTWSVLKSLGESAKRFQETL